MARNAVSLNIKGTFYRYLIFFPLLICWAPGLWAQDSQAVAPRVLFIASYHPGFPTFFDQVEGLKAVLEPQGIRLDIEFMDAKRFVPALAEQTFLTSLSAKLALLSPYDLVITADDTALQFVMKVRASLFNQVPVVFFGVNDADYGLSFKPVDKVTGVLEQPSFVDTVQLIRRLEGEYAEIVAITDGSPTGLLDTAHFKQQMARIGFHQYQVLSLQELTLDALWDKVKLLQVPASLLVISAYRTEDGKTLQLEEFMSALHAHSRVPIFHLWHHGLGQGAIGGKLVSHRQQAKLAAQMAVKILQGTPVAQLPVVQETANQWLFDFAEMQRFGFTVKDMPKGSHFINQPDSLYERYRAYIGLLLAFVTALFLIIASLVVRIRTRRAFERKLVDINQQLESNILLRTQALDEARQEAEGLLRVRNVILNNSLVGIVLVIDRKIEWVNSYAEIMFGYSSEEVIGRSAEFIYANRVDFDKVGQQAPAILQRGESFRAEFLFRRKDDTVLWGIIHGKALNPANLEDGVLYIIMDISQRKRVEDQLRDANARLEALATTDHLTGISNRRRISALLGEELERCVRYQQSCSVILLDIDHFKSINDRHGHDVGDQVLKEVAVLLQQTLRKVDRVARWGGEEFLVLCPATVASDAAKLAALLRGRIELHDFPLPTPVTASFGVAGYETGQTPDQLIKLADQALYQAKVERNCVRIHPGTHPPG